jgi:hypothetical protein
MSNAINSEGKVVNIGDQVSIIALVVSTAVSATVPSSTVAVTFETPWTNATFVAQAADANAVEHSNDAAHPALSFNGGKNYGAAGDAATPLGTVTSITGSGVTALLSVVLVTSGATIVVPAGAVQSAAAYGGSQ